MSQKQIKVTFETITPIWTGDAWGDNKELRPSSLMGSLRFWFEVICYFAEITDKSNYKDGKLKDEVNEKKFKEKIVTNGSDFEGIDKTLAQMGISLPSRIFGCTGWKGWVRIKNIKPSDKDYSLGNSLDLPYALILNKKNINEIEEFKTRENLNKFIDSQYENGNLKDKQKEFRKDYSVWYVAMPYFSGKFEVVFEIEENIIESIFYPLLTFMEKFGFWGGKWNIGYGRLKVEIVKKKEGEEWTEINGWGNKKFKFSHFYKSLTTKFADKEFLETKITFDEIQQKNKIMYLKNQVNNTTDVKKIIKQLIIMKTERRKYYRDNINDVNLRHLLFGTTKSPPDKKDLPQGTKIIPWIYKEKGQLKGGFVSIAGILNLGD